MGISPQQFKQMQQRLAGRRRTARPVLGTAIEALASPDMTAALPVARGSPQAVILGLDPSLRGTGFGVIRRVGSGAQAVAFGTIRCPANWRASRCLAHIAHSVRDVLKHHAPSVCVVEGLFYAQNLRTALVMGEARGAALATIAEAGLEIYEVAPRKVKQAIVGYGAAQKLAVAKMVQRILRLAQPPEPDAADALALALTHAQEAGRYALNPPRPI